MSLAWIYRVPGSKSDNTRHASGSRITYDTCQVAEGYCPDGWHTSLEAAADAAFAPEPVAAPSEPAEDVVDDAPPTRAELEAKAAELGIKVDKRWGDRRLMQEVVKALEGTGD